VAGAFNDSDEPFALFLLDYISIMGLLVFVSHYTSEGMRKRMKKVKEGDR
jgi:hypothetical protein